MNVSAIDQINNIAEAQKQNSPDAMRRAAMQFEALLLMQLTSALNSTSGSDDEESLFGSDGGSDLAKKMFSEQLATSMSESGGVGMSDMIMRQLGGTKDGGITGGIKGLSDVMSSVRGLKDKGPDAAIDNSSLIKRSAKAVAPIAETFSGNPEDAAVISTFEDDMRTNGIDDSLKNLMLDGRILNSTRARIVPNSPVTEMQEFSSGPVFDAKPNVSFQMPVSGRISSDFGTRFHPIDRKTKFHGGVDIAVAKGTPVAAAAEGTVTFAGWSGGYGNLVIVKHPDGRETRYGHLETLTVSEGESVAGGQKIALSGSTGKSTGPHLHFEVRENGQAVDPFRILSNVLPKTAER